MNNDFVIFTCSNDMALVEWANEGGWEGRPSGIQVWMPLRWSTKTVQKDHNKIQVPVKKPAMNGYIYVTKGKHESFRDAASTRLFNAKIMYLHMTHRPATASLAELHTMQSLINQGPVNELIELSEGNECVILAGPFMSQTCVISKGGTNGTKRVRIGSFYLNIPKEWLKALH